MVVVRRCALLLSLTFFAGAAFAQTESAPTGKVDFARDVQPIFRKECVGCHGPNKQIAGLRMDQKSSVLKAQTRRLVPGSTENSLLFHRLIDNEYGEMMPPTGELKPAEVAVIRHWIEQGAEWPDALSNETPLPPVDRKAEALIALLRNGETTAFLKQVTAEPALLNARGPGGATPFMEAVLYASPTTLARLLALGADPNRANDANATPLMWAAGSLAKTKLLLDHGAQVNVESDAYHTPLMIAARHPGGAPVVKLLLDRGADVNPHAKTGIPSSPLTEALSANDVATFDLLIAHGADAKATGEAGLTTAITNGCMHCVQVLAAKITSKAVYTGSLQDVAVFADARYIQLLLDHGADVNSPDTYGRTPLMFAVTSDLLPVETVKLLIAHGANVNARDAHKTGGDSGWSVLHMAESHGDTPIAQMLLAAGAKPEAAAPPATASVTLTAHERRELRSAIGTAQPLMQHTDITFATKAGCMSCHNNNLVGVAVALAREKGIPVDETIAAAQVKANAQVFHDSRDPLLQGDIAPVGDNFSENVIGFALWALDAEHYQGDLGTDAGVQELLLRQTPEGNWPFPNADQRPPICLDHIANTALAMRSLQLYAPKPLALEAKRAVAKAASWLAGEKTYSNEDLSWKLTGLAWAGANKTALLATRKQLLATQKADGSWADLASMPGSAYATGKDLVALKLAGLPMTDPAYQRGVQWLLDHQLKDGTWFVPTRALGFQPAFDAEFPHGNDQWMSSAGTSWAVLALLYALPAEPTKVAETAVPHTGSRGLR